MSGNDNSNNDDRIRTNKYRHCSSEKDSIKAIVNGCPVTAASVLRSLRTCSTCFSLITEKEIEAPH